MRLVYNTTEKNTEENYKTQFLIWKNTIEKKN